MRTMPPATLVLLLLAGCATPSADLATSATLPTSPGLHEIVLSVEGEEATGVFAVPLAPSTSLVVFGHWYGGTPELTREIAAQLAAMGTYVVAMDYREPGPWNVEKGTQDMLAATELVLREHPELDEVIAQGFSMGGEVTGMLLARAPPGTFDHWITGAGVMDLADEWTKMPIFQADVEAETGGRPDEVPDAYAARSPRSLVDGIAAQGLTRVYILHATGDPIVPFGQAEAMYDALAAAGVPVTLYEAQLTDGIGLCQPECDAIPVGPAGHEVGLFDAFPLVQHRIERLAEIADATVRGTYDGRTDRFDPEDVPR